MTFHLHISFCLTFLHIIIIMHDTLHMLFCSNSTNRDCILVCSHLEVSLFVGVILHSTELDKARALCVTQKLPMYILYACAILSSYF